LFFRTNKYSNNFIDFLFCWVKWEHLFSGKWSQGYALDHRLV
jgi:hypothetical protein